MSMSNNEIQVTWPTAANSKAVAAGADEVSEAFTFSVDRIAASISLKADNAGTPASGDTIDFYILWTTGDPDGASTDEYDAEDEFHGDPLGRVDTNTTDPGQRTVDIPIGAKGGKVYAVSSASSNSITVSAAINEVLSGA